MSAPTTSQASETQHAFARFPSPSPASIAKSNRKNGKKPSTLQLDIDRWLKRYTPETLHDETGHWLVLKGANPTSSDFCLLVHADMTSGKHPRLKVYKALGSTPIIPKDSKRPEAGNKIHLAALTALDEYTGTTYHTDDETNSPPNLFHTTRFLYQFRQLTRPLAQGFSHKFGKQLQPVEPATQLPREDRKKHLRQNIDCFLHATLDQSNKAAIRQFSCSLDQDTLKTLRKIRWLDPFAYNWIEEPEEATSRLYRRQAVELLPTLIPLMATTDRQKTASLTEKIDTAQPWLDEARSLLLDTNAPRSAIKRLYHTNPATMGHALFSTAPQQTRLTATLEKHRHPTTPRQWKELYKAGEACRAFARISHKNPAETITEARSDWGTFADEIHNRSRHNTLDYVTRIYQRLVAPTFFQLLGDASDPEIAARFFISPYTTNALVIPAAQQMLHQLWHQSSSGKIDKYSTSWHNDYERYRAREDRAGIISSDSFWLAVTPEIKAPNGIILSPLHSADSLKNESNKMAHCVEGSIQRAYHGAIALYHLTDPTESPTSPGSTLEIKLPQSKSEQYTFVQHKTYKNKEPRPRETLAATWFFQQLSSNIIKPDWEKLSPHFAENRARTKEESASAYAATRYVGFDPLNYDIHNTLFDGYRDVLPLGNTPDVRTWLDKTGLHTTASRIITTLQP